VCVLKWMKLARIAPNSDLITRISDVDLPVLLSHFQFRNNFATNFDLYRICEEPGSSGSTVSGYGLDDRAIQVRSPAGPKDFSSRLCVQTGSGAHPASCTMDTGGPFPGSKARPGRDAGHSTPSSAKVVNE
jgi:hypothetical protein